jgi:hypothetical protein
MLLFLTITSFTLLMIIMVGLIEAIDRWIKHLYETTDLFDSYK